MSESKLVIAKNCKKCYNKECEIKLTDDDLKAKVRHVDCHLDSNVESALELVNGKLYEREYYDNHYSTSSDYDYKEVDLTLIKAELSKIPALEKELQDKETLIKIKDNVNEQLSSTLNEIEEVIKKSRYKKAQEIIKNLPFIDDKDLKYVISPTYSMEEIERIIKEEKK